MTYSVPDMSRQPKLGRSRERFDVVVIGAGQAGLALGCFLARAGRRFADGSELDVDAVVWATGYRADYSWLTLPALDEDASATGAVSPRSPASTCSACPGSTRAAQHFWAGSRTTPSSSPTSLLLSRTPRRPA